MEHVSPLKPSFTFYPPHSLTNSAKELINELRLQFQSTSLRTPLIHRLMKIPGTNSSSNNRRTIKSSLLNRTPILPIHPAIKASNETTKSHFMLWIFWKRKKKRKRKRRKQKSYGTTARSVLRYAWWRRKIASVSEVSPTTIHINCFSFFKRRQTLPSFHRNDQPTCHRQSLPVKSNFRSIINGW